MPIDYTQLAAEINTDPRGYGYAADVAVGNDQGVANRLNAIRNGSNPPANPTGDGGNADGSISVKRADVSAKEVVSAVALADMPALPANPNSTALSNERRSLAYLGMLSCIEGQIALVNDDGTNTPIIANIAGIFTAGSDTLTRLNALRFRFGSRAEELSARNGWGVSSVSSNDVAKALRG